MVRKGQIAGQVFVYMMAAIVIGAIMIIGWKAVSGMTPKMCNAEKINFQSNILELIERYDSYGSVNKKSIKAPCDYNTVCFVSANAISNDYIYACPKPIIRDSVTSNAEQNIFAVSNNQVIPIGYSPLIHLDESLEHPIGCLCIDEVGGSFNIEFHGQGSFTVINEG